LSGPAFYDGGDSYHGCRRTPWRRAGHRGFFLLAAVACALAALCYSEFAADGAGLRLRLHLRLCDSRRAGCLADRMDLILEYAISNAAVAVSWSGYLQALLRQFSLEVPAWLGTDFWSAMRGAAQLAAAQEGHKDLSMLGADVLRNAEAWQQAPHLFVCPWFFNLPGFLIVVVITGVVLVGIRETARFNTGLVVFKLAVIGFFLVLGATCIKTQNWTHSPPTV